MRRDTAAIAIGAAVGLAWSTSLRAWMVHLTFVFSGRPRFTWHGTFLSVLAPAAAVGALIALDWHRRREGRRPVRGVVWSPLLLVVGPALVADDFFGTLLETGEGSGAIGIVLIGMTGGYALSGRGRPWLRWLTVAPAIITTVAMAAMFYASGQPVTPSGVFGANHLVVPGVWLAAGCSVPLRAPQPTGSVPDASTVAAHDGRS